MEKCRVTRRGMYCKNEYLNNFDSKKKRKQVVFNDLYNGYSSPDEINNIAKNIRTDNIKELYIEGVSNIDNSILSSLVKNKSLRSLIITNATFSVDNIDKIKSFLSNSISLNKLVIDSPKFHDIPEKYSCGHLLNEILHTINYNLGYSAWQEKIPLNYVSFSNCNIDVGIESFNIYISTLLNRGKLHFLKLHNIGLRDRTIELISAALNIDRDLNELDISNNVHVSDIGGQAIVDALKSNKSNKLKKINVSGTHISANIRKELKKYVKLDVLEWKFMKELEHKGEFYGYKI